MPFRAMRQPLVTRPTLLIILVGLVMIASSSSTIAASEGHSQLYYFYRQLLYLIIGGGVMLVAVNMPMHLWQKITPYFLLFCLLLLLLVLIPGVGRELNGARRWLNLKVIGLQASEFAKLAIVLYVADYLTRHGAGVKENFWDFIKPLLVVMLMLMLLLAEPDFGAGVVIASTVLGVLFLAGVRWPQFLAIVATGAVGLGTLAIIAPYRWARLTTFLNPWAHPFDSGYQLTQSLMAFGRGSIWGVGLGDSLQKQFYLPEPHTDFIFAVIAEELGLVGVSCLLLLFIMLMFGGFKIALRAKRNQAMYASYVAYGLSIILAMQVIINIGVNTGLLPTKGLTLPLMSYGGSSLWMNLLTVALLLRVGIETGKKNG